MPQQLTMISCFQRFTIRVIFPVFISIVFLINVKVAYSHPHVFVENSIEIALDKRGVSGFEVNWVFDEMTSAGFILDYDTNRDGKFSSDEIKVLKKEAFDYLKNYHYMLDISVGEKKFEVEYVKYFFPKIIKSRLVYRFFVPCHVSAIKPFKVIHLSVYDDEYFVNYSTKKENIHVRDDTLFDCDLKIETNRDKSFYFGQFHPREITFKFKKR